MVMGKPGKHKIFCLLVSSLKINLPNFNLPDYQQPEQMGIKQYEQVFPCSRTFLVSKLSMLFNKGRSQASIVFTFFLFDC